MIYADDYGIVDTQYLVFASMLNARDEDDDHDDFLIILVLHVGHHGHNTAISYPSRSLRDAAFERLVALVQRTSAHIEEDE
jgi:hypothetical protein